MSLEQVTSGQYKEFALQAAKLEQQTYWKEAAKQWAQAEVCAKRQENKLWAFHRQEHCIRRLSRST